MKPARAVYIILNDSGEASEAYLSNRYATYRAVSWDQMFPESGPHIVHKYILAPKLTKKRSK